MTCRIHDLDPGGRRGGHRSRSATGWRAAPRASTSTPTRSTPGSRGAPRASLAAADLEDLARTLGPRHRGRRRGPADEAGDLPGARRRGRPVGHPRDEHERPLGRRDRRRHEAAGARPRACTSSIPAPVMRLVEVVGAPATSPVVLDRPSGSWTAWGKTPVRSADTPGFIVNRVNRPFTIEPLAALEAGEARGRGHRRRDARRRLPDGPVRAHGPHRSRRQPRCQPALHAAAVAAGDPLRNGSGRPPSRPSWSAGRLGRKAGGGFYDGPRTAADDAVADAVPGAARRRRGRPGGGRGHRADRARDRRRGPPGARRGGGAGGRHRPGAAARCRPPDGPVRAGRRAGRRAAVARALA